MLVVFLCVLRFSCIQQYLKDARLSQLDLYVGAQTLICPYKMKISINLYSCYNVHASQSDVLVAISRLHNFICVQQFQIAADKCFICNVCTSCHNNGCTNTRYGKSGICYSWQSTRPWRHYLLSATASQTHCLCSPQGHEYSQSYFNNITFQRTRSLSNAVCFKLIQYLTTNTVILVLLCTFLLYPKRTHTVIHKHRALTPACVQRLWYLLHHVHEDWMWHGNSEIDHITLI